MMYPLGIILIMAQNYRPMYFGTTYILLFQEKTNIIWKLTLVAAIINIVLTIITVPVFGWQATAYCSYIGFFYMGYAGFYYRTYKQISSEQYYPLVWLTVNTLLTVMAYFMVELNVLTKIASTLISGITALMLIYRFNKNIMIK